MAYILFFLHYAWRLFLVDPPEIICKENIELYKTLYFITDSIKIIIFIFESYKIICAILYIMILHKLLYLSKITSII